MTEALNDWRGVQTDSIIGSSLESKFLSFLPVLTLNLLENISCVYAYGPSD